MYADTKINVQNILSKICNIKDYIQLKERMIV